VTNNKLWKGKMQNQNVDQSLKSCSNEREDRKVYFGWLSVALVLSLAVGFALVAHTALAPMLPKLPNRPEGFGARLVWYFQEGQIKTDLRSLAALLQYLVEPEPNTLTMTNYANVPVAGNATSNSPTSLDSLPAGFVPPTTPG
jgi:hypothetical protein